LKTEKLLLYGAAGIAVFAIFSKARALGNLVFTPGTVSAMGFTNGVPTADVTLIAQNTSTTGLTINSFAGNVFSNNILIGNIFSFAPVHISGNSQTPINVSIQFKPLGVVTDLISAWNTNNFSQDITVEGFANVLGLQLPINLRFKFGTP
jgi:hypothetical protein